MELRTSQVRRPQFTDLPVEVQGNIFKTAGNVNTISGIQTIASLRQVSRETHALVDDPYIMGMKGTDKTVWEMIREFHEYIRLHILHYERMEIVTDVIVVRRNITTEELYNTVLENIDVRVKNDNLFLVPHYERRQRQQDETDMKPVKIEKSNSILIKDYMLYNGAYLAYTTYYSEIRNFLYHNYDEEVRIINLRFGSYSHEAEMRRLKRIYYEDMVMNYTNEEILQKMQKDRERMQKKREEKEERYRKYKEEKKSRSNFYIIKKEVKKIL